MKLSQASRATLLKTVLQTIPNYAMSCFRLPDMFLSELERVIRQLSSGIVALNPKSIGSHGQFCVSTRRRGGLGFRHLRECNTGLLPKQAWRIALGSGGVLHSVLP
ncbi:UNVERIFIED_CONTAM: hypothetical protein Slati_2740800 [Sesamum latifolium]|uniref:Uncharacterized protein n=1 Tax=Sesamum latifolium TaxID=2727402 RepID=A0AAW2VX27_9LAMI